ncbi:MAG TPA: serine hydrolase domain-containing protein, partial [Polyangiaceae bacterium]|nr:serine hydrolase domain-containing protein [Polyangiaceae bacterium]
MRTLFFSLVVAQTIAACTARESPEGAGGSSGTGASVGGGGSGGGEAWAAVSARVEAAASENGVADLGLYVFDETDQRVYALELGAFRSSTNIAVASASKLVSGMVLFDVIRRGALTLDSTPGQVLGWIGPTADLTLKHLLSFTSGLDPEPPCTHSLLTTLEACVDNIGTTAAIAAPGARFDYGPSHLHVAARMAEVATGKSWDALFDEVFRAPLQLASDARYYTLPKQSSG